MPGFTFFDVNLTIGRPNRPKYRVVTDARVMAGQLAPLGITGGLVRHTLSAEAHPTIGNPLASVMLEGTDAFEAVWAVMPHWTGEFAEPDKLAEEMSRHGVRAVVIHPAKHGFGLRETVTGPLFDMLADAHVPVFVSIMEADLAAIEGAAREHPSMPVVILGASHQIARQLYPLLTACPNVHIEISYFMLHRGIEEVCGKFGPKRLLFGSAYPLFEPGCAIAAVMYSEVPDEAKERIASGNARELIEGVRL